MKKWQKDRISIIEEILSVIMSNNFILKGGTALMLYYGLDRFSEDIDLDSKTTNMNILKDLEKYNQKNNKEWKISLKKDTDTVFRIMVDYGAEKENGNYPLKIEISSRNKDLLRSNNLEYNNIEGVNVYSLEEIIDMKISAFNNRDKIRDFYDIAFFLREKEELFDINRIKRIKLKLDYQNMEDLECLLKDEFEVYELKKIDVTKIIINTYDKIQELIEKYSRK